MEANNIKLLVVNAGSSSIKIGLFDAANSKTATLEGCLVGIGQPKAIFAVKGASESDNSTQNLEATDYPTAINIMIDWLKQKTSVDDLQGIGHRIVHGGPKYNQAVMLTDQVIADLGELSAFDPEHLPAELQLVGALQQAFPNIPQVACFDTAFHHDLPNVARLLPIPRSYEAKGIRRYGFHGLSYAYLMSELERVSGPETANGRVILAHLGSGASLAAVQNGQSIDTSMSLTPTGGIPMSTRSGDLDPSVAVYLTQHEGLNAEQLNQLINYESGLLGLSETSSDMEQLLQSAGNDPRAADAVNLFCYQVKKYIGSYAAALGGLDTLIFSGGIGENAPKIRSQICQDLEFLGIKILEESNTGNLTTISSDDSKVKVMVFHTDEAQTIVSEMTRLLPVTTGNQRQL
jgi:acetate kinase